MATTIPPLGTSAPAAVVQETQSSHYSSPSASSPTTTSRMTEDSLRAPRVSQIDAQELDDGLIHMLSGRIKSALAVFGPHVGSRYGPEIELALRLVVFRLGVMGSLTRSTPGLKLQSLKFSIPSTSSSSTGWASHILRQIRIRLLGDLPPAALALYLYPVLTFLPSYIISKLNDRALDQRWADYPRRSWKRWWYNVLEKATWGGKLWELGGWSAFLWDGMYPSLTNRLLGLRIIPADPSGQVNRMVSYEFMNRQLVWYGLTEFLLTLLPLIRSRRSSIRRLGQRVMGRFTRILRTMDQSRFPREYALDPSKDTPSSSFPGASFSSGSQPMSSNKNSGQPKKRGPYHNLPSKFCGICYQRLRPGFDHDLGLPSLEDPATDAGTSEADVPASEHTAPGVGPDGGIAAELEEAVIHIPGRGDCAQACQYCYHCLAQEVAKRATTVKEDLAVDEGLEEKERDEEDRIRGWSCLRCATEVWEVTRVT